MIQIRIKLFAVVRDLAGKENVTLTLPASSTAGDAIDVLLEEYPSMKKWKPHLRVAVNCEYVSKNVSLHENDEVALIPPVSGG